MRDWPRHPLPGDLQELLQHADGLHLWADLDTGRSYQGLAPIAEWELARTRMWGSDADPDSLGDVRLHKRRKPQPWLGFSVEAPVIEDGAGITAKAIVH